MDILRFEIGSLIDNFNNYFSGCLKNTTAEFLEKYRSQIIISTIYDSIADICALECISDIGSFMVGATYLASYDYIKLKVLVVFILFSLGVLLICRLVDKICCLNIAAFLYTLVIFVLWTFVSCNTSFKLLDLEKSEHHRMLLVAFMNIVAYTSYRPISFLPYYSWHFLGYMFNPTNVVYGPWLSVEMYDSVFIRKRNALEEPNRLWNFTRAINICKYCTTSYLFYICSNCIIPVITSQNDHFWLLVLSKTLSYRFMHYAQCYISSATLLAAGNNYYFGNWKFPITYVLNVELPISIPGAVTSYDKQLSLFLRKFYANRFEYLKSIYSHSDLVLIPLLYLTTCFDHPALGMTVAIFNLYIFERTQMYCQDAVAEGFSICIRRYPCSPRQCPHRFKPLNPITITFKLLFMTLNIVMINYLTIAVFEEPIGNYKGYLEVWKQLHYIGHHIFFAYFVSGFFIYNMLLDPMTTRNSNIQQEISRGKANTSTDTANPDSIAVNLIQALDSKTLLTKKDKSKK